MLSYINAFRRVADWSGRSKRSEFWGFFLINLIITVSLAVLSQTGAGFAIAYLVYALVVLFPGLGVTVRRLHDCGKSGGWVLLGFVPILGFMLLFVLAQESDPWPNKYGPSQGQAGQS